MACYDCEDCKHNSYYGGKCNRFEYNCPFIVVENYSSDKLETIRNIVPDRRESIKKLQEIDEDRGLMFDEIYSVNSSLIELKDKVSTEIEQEWNEISK